jgi:thioredoxin 1
MLAPVIEEIDRANPDVKVGKVDVTTEMRSAAKFGVRGIPKLVYLKDGEVVHESVGAQSLGTIQEQLNSLK